MKKQFAALFIGVLTALSAHAEVQWSFSIKNPSVSIGPTDSVSIFGEISNLASSTDVLSVSNCTPPSCVLPSQLTVGFAEFPPVFNFDEGPMGPDSLYMTLAALTLNPGERFSFVAYTLSPLAGLAPIGNYQYIVNDLYLAGYGIGSAGVVNVAVVPEPSSSALMLAGLLFLGARLSRRHAAG